MIVAIKEKLIFVASVMVLILLVVFGASKLAKPRKDISPSGITTSEREIELPKLERVKVDMAVLTTTRPLSDYLPIKDRSPFFKYVPPEPEPLPSPEAIVPPKREILVYKGRVIIGELERVIIEEGQTGEIYFVGRGEKVRGYVLIDVHEKEVVLSGEDGSRLTLRLKE